MSRKITLCLLLFAGLLGACAPKSAYNWGEYEAGLYSYYKDPENLDALMKTLDLAIAGGETDQRVPPGLYAEYGYLLMVKGRRDDAVIYFNKEKSAWPESAVLMDKLISASNASQPKQMSDSAN